MFINMRTKKKKNEKEKQRERYKQIERIVCEYNKTVNGKQKKTRKGIKTDDELVVYNHVEKKHGQCANYSMLILLLVKYARPFTKIFFASHFIFTCPQTHLLFNLIYIL